MTEQFKGMVTLPTGQVEQGAVEVSAANPLPVKAGSSYASPNGNAVATNTTLDSLFSDDFGGNAVDTVNNWDVLDGGLGANANLGHGVLTQGAIGSGITGMSDAVAASGLTVTMGTTLGAERWYLSKQVFAGKEDILVLLSRSQGLAANSVFVGLVEVDPLTWVPLLNSNFAADGNGSGEFTNRGGAEFSGVTTSTAYHAEAIGDSSSTKASGLTGVAAAMTTTQEYLIEIDSRDVIVSSATIDNITAKGSNASRVSSQCPNDKKLYKLVMRFRNTGTAATSSSIVIQRILVADNYEMRVQISSGEGDTIPNKGVPVNAQLLATVAGTPPLIGSVTLSPDNSRGATVTHKLQSAASTNANSVAAANQIYGGYLYNRNAAARYFKVYNKASPPSVGTDTPVQTWVIPANDKLSLAAIVPAYGLRLNVGVAYAITANYADGDATAISAGDVDVNLICL